MALEQVSTLRPNPIVPPPLDERFFVALSKGLVEAVFVIELNSRCVVYWNESAETLFKFPKNEIVHQSAARLFADRSMFERIYALALMELEKHDLWRGECQYRRQDGSTFIAETAQSLLSTDCGSYIIVTVRDNSDGKDREQVVRWLNRQLSRDFSERNAELNAKDNDLEKAQNQHRHTERLLEILVRNLTNNAILFLSTEGYIVHCNKGTEQLFDYTAHELEQIHLSRLFKPAVADQDKWRKMLEKATQQEDGVRDYEWLVRKDGSSFFARLEILALREEAGAVNGYLIFLRDDTEQKKIREQLREKEHMATIGTATAMLAHEIRNPLNGMSTTVQLLERSLQSNFEPTKEMVVGTVQDLKTEIARLQALLGDFHAISHPQQMNSRLVDLPELIRELMSLVMPESHKQKITIVEEFDAELPRVSGDPDKLKQVFLNLIKNGFEAMPSGGTLTAKVSAGNACVCVEIADTGVGIKDGLNVFDLFCSTKAHGTGLGLAIARQIVLAHNGSIDYSSKVGERTSFRVVLPAPQSRILDRRDCAKQ